MTDALLINIETSAPFMHQEYILPKCVKEFANPLLHHVPWILAMYRIFCSTTRDEIKLYIYSWFSHTALPFMVWI